MKIINVYAFCDVVYCSNTKNGQMCFRYGIAPPTRITFNYFTCETFLQFWYADTIMEHLCDIAALPMLSVAVLLVCSGQVVFLFPPTSNMVAGLFHNVLKLYWHL